MGLLAHGARKPKIPSLHIHGQPVSTGPPAGPDLNQTAALPCVYLLSSAFLAESDQADRSPPSRVLAQLHLLGKARPRVHQAVNNPGHCEHSSDDGARRRDEVVPAEHTACQRFLYATMQHPCT